MLTIVAAVVIASCFALSSAQSQPSPQCITAYNATFGDTATDTTCVAAYYSLLFGSATEEQGMMVCDAGQQCNTMIENVISTCGDTVSQAFNYVKACTHVAGNVLIRLIQSHFCEYVTALIF